MSKQYLTPLGPGKTIRGGVVFNITNLERLQKQLKDAEAIVKITDDPITREKALVTVDSVKKQLDTLAANVSELDRLRRQVVAYENTAKNATDCIERTRAESDVRSARTELAQAEKGATVNVSNQDYTGPSAAEITVMENSTDPATRKKALVLHVQRANCASRKEKAARLATKKSLLYVDGVRVDNEAVTFAAPVPYYQGRGVVAA